VRGLRIGIGNPLRRDDGVAAVALHRIPADDNWRSLELIQLTPEVAAEFTGFDRVVFVDADAGEGCGVLLEAITEAGSEPLTHHSTPAAVVALARCLYGFSGIAEICRIPAEDFGYGEGLSARAEAMAEEAARLLSRS